MRPLSTRAGCCASFSGGIFSARYLGHDSLNRFLDGLTHGMLDIFMIKLDVGVFPSHFSYDSLNHGAYWREVFGDTLGDFPSGLSDGCVRRLSSTFLGG